MKAGASRPIQLLQLRDGALGWSGGRGRHRCSMGHRRPRSKRPASACATRARGTGCLVVGSETGMVPHSSSRRSSRRAGSGLARRSAWIWRSGPLLITIEELKDHLAGLKPYSTWVEHITHVSTTVRRAERGRRMPAQFDTQGAANAARRSTTFPWRTCRTRCWRPWCWTPRKPVGSMGDDTPLGRALSKQISRAAPLPSGSSSARSPTRPSIPLREWRVMSIKTRFGNLGNVIASEDPSQTTHPSAREPVPHHEHRACGPCVDYFGQGHAAPSTVPSQPTAACLLAPMRSMRIRQEAEEAVRGGCQ